MTSEELLSIINEPEYNFLRTDPRLNNNLLFITLGGSFAYGTNIENSDIDIRGVYLDIPKNLLLSRESEVFVNNPTDTTIYGFNRIIQLLTQCNPNCIELLGNKKEHYVYYSPLAKYLLENKEIFLSKRCVNTFGGYATSQFNRLENAKNESLGKRNKYAIEHGKISKHMMHCMRLYFMGIDLLIEHEIKTFRDKDHDELMDIRNGKYIKNDGEILPEFFERAKELEAKFYEAAAKTTLPDHPDIEKIEELQLKINSEIMRHYLRKTIILK